MLLPTGERHTTFSSPWALKMTSSFITRRQQIAKALKAKKDAGIGLVELLVSVVIVGVLGAVSLPQFTSQVAKAQATECTQQAGAILGQVGAEGAASATAANDVLNALTTAATASSSFCTFTPVDLANGVARITLEGKGDLVDKFEGDSCVNVTTGTRDITTGYNGDTPVAAVCA